MSSTSGLLSSSIAKKYWMALTGLFLCLFLVGHLAGNLQLLVGGEEGQLAFNEYAKFMTTNPLVKVLSYVTYFSILFHAIDGVVLTMQNKKARPVGYAQNNAAANSSWASRSMALLGVITLAFIVIHMKSFWFEMHFGELGVDSSGNRDLWTLTVTSFKQLWYVAFYVVAMVMLGFHLSHGFSSAFQSLGLRSGKYVDVLDKAGKWFTFVICGLFAIIPVYIYLMIEL